MKNIWDYDLPKDWTPNTDQEWEWFLVRKLNYGDYQGLNRTIISNYFSNIKKQLDPGKRDMIHYFLTHGTDKRTETRH